MARLIAPPRALSQRLSDPRFLPDAAAELERFLAYVVDAIEGRIETQKDIIVDIGTKGLVLKDAGGPPHYWRVTISTTGTLVTTDLGTKKP